MKDESRHADGSRGTGRSLGTPIGSQGTAPTPLQEWFAAVFDVLDDARDALNHVEFRIYVWILRERLEIEAAKLAVVEAEQATGGAA